MTKCDGCARASSGWPPVGGLHSVSTGPRLSIGDAAAVLRMTKRDVLDLITRRVFVESWVIQRDGHRRLGVRMDGVASLLAGREGRPTPNPRTTRRETPVPHGIL